MFSGGRSMSPIFLVIFYGNSRADALHCAQRQMSTSTVAQRRSQESIARSTVLARATSIDPRVVRIAQHERRATCTRSLCQTAKRSWPRCAQPARRRMTFQRVPDCTQLEIGKERWIRWWCVGQAARLAATRSRYASHLFFSKYRLDLRTGQHGVAVLLIMRSSRDRAMPTVNAFHKMVYDDRSTGGKFIPPAKKLSPTVHFRLPPSGRSATKTLLPWLHST